MRLRYFVPVTFVLVIAIVPTARADMFQDCNQSADPDLSIAGCTRALRAPRLNDKNRGFVYNNRGNAYKRKKDFDRAIADFDQSIRFGAGNPHAYNGRGDAWREKGESDRAIADFDKAIRLNSKIPFFYSNRAMAWSDKTDFDRALTDANEAIRLDPKAASAYNTRGTIWREKGETDRALADFGEAIRLDPKSAFPYTNRATVWKDIGDPDRAAADYSMAVRLDPTDRVLYNNRGLFWSDRGDLDRAMIDMDEAVRLGPKNGKAYANRGEIWRLKGDLTRALADQDQAVRLTPTDSLSFIRRGDTLRYIGEFGRALADYDQALVVEPGYVPAYTGRGLTYEKLGNLARARTEFEKAIASLHPAKADISKSSLETARARLAALESGSPPPVILAAPSKPLSPNSIPTLAVAVPIVARAAVAAAIPAAIKQGRRVALVIGNSAYKNVPALANPQRDADKIAASLRAIGFESVITVNDSTRDKLVDTLRTFAEEAEKADWAMVYYAGHGIEVNGMNYLIPVEARLATDRDVQFEAVPLDQVMASVEGAKKLRLIVLDACRDNPFAPQMRRAPVPEVTAATSTAGGRVVTRSVGRGLGEVKVAGATLVVYAAKHGQTALDGEGGNSPFAVAIVQRIATPNVELFKIFRLVRDDVMEATAGRQEPYTYGSLPGREDFFFVAN